MNSVPLIKKFVIKGLHYYQDFEIEFNNFVTILVGENGLGKTTVLNILYSTITSEWQFLSQFGFDSVEILFLKGDAISFTHSELEAYIIETETIKKKDKLDMFSEYESFERVVTGNIQKFKEITTTIANNLSVKIIYFSVYRLLRENLSFFSRELTSVPHKNVYKDFTDLENELLMPLNGDYLLKNIPDTNSDHTHFIEICNRYLVNTKLEFIKTYKIFVIKNKISNELVSYEQLSSGEKQILFVFSNVFLLNHKDVIVLFDEPELSLSLPWQRTILTDLISSQKCNLVLAVTHSPFIFDNYLDKYTFGINTCFKLK